MENRKTVFVTGATGNQGAAAARNLLSRGFRIKALTRDPGSAKARALAGDQVELIRGDLNEPASYKEYLQNTDAVFCNLHFNEGVAKELQQGIALIDLSRERGIDHFVYSSVIGSDMNTGIPHWESKAKIESHLRSSGLSHTILRPSSLFENLLLPAVKSRIMKGKLVLPTRVDKIQQFISSEDVGRISSIILSNPGKYSGRIISLASEQLDGRELAALFSDKFGREVKFQQLPGIITLLVMGRGLAKMFRWINEHDALFIKDLPAIKNEFPGMLVLGDWIREHFTSS
ncbi:MAG: NmrA/HSCARG family protein [Chitinophagaceae bacterium]